jgi:hypothetical protein
LVASDFLISFGREWNGTIKDQKEEKMKYSYKRAKEKTL